MRRRLLRVALISMLEHGGSPRGALRVGGVSVAEEQLAVALSLGCERVFCLASGMSPSVLALQHAAERAGARFQAIPGPRSLLGQLTATDELIALADGLFASVTEAQALLEPGPVVLVQPAEAGVEAGFERIDQAQASGGALRLPGRLVEKLADVPGDWDAFSALLRIGLQAGIAQRPLSPAGQASGFWTLLRDETEAHALEPQWIRRRTRQFRQFNPARGLAQVLVRSFGPALLHAGSGARFVASGAGVLAVLALGAGWFGFAGAGLAAAGLSWTLGETAGLLDRVETERFAPPKRSWTLYGLFGWVIDALLVALIGWAIPVEPWHSALERYFPALMLIGLLRILPRTFPDKWTAWLEDRALLTLVVGLAMIAGLAGPVVYGLALALAAVGIFAPGTSPRITPP
ncbi:MAG: hypothetical protein O9272_01155 [Brevundimonas sp.]|nr:hypothetical protein [Brevundimonas sp.]